MEGLLGCWRSFFPPLSLDPEVSTQARHLCKSLSAKGVTVNEEMLKVCGFLHPIPFLASESDLLLCPGLKAAAKRKRQNNSHLHFWLVFQAVLSASPVLSEEDLKRFALGVSPQWDMECDRLLHAAVSRLADRDEPSGHVVLILDKVGFIISAEYLFTCRLMCAQSTFLREKMHTKHCFVLLYGRVKLKCTNVSPVLFAVPSEAAVGEHLHLKLSLCQPNAVSALTYWTEHSKRGEVKLFMPCGADASYFLTVRFSGGYGFFYFLPCRPNLSPSWSKVWIQSRCFMCWTLMPI